MAVVVLNNEVCRYASLTQRLVRRNDRTHDRYLSAFICCIDRRDSSSHRYVAMAALNITPGRSIPDCVADRTMASGKSNVRRSNSPLAANTSAKICSDFPSPDSSLAARAAAVGGEVLR
jgi:hypothetical protein